MSKRTDSFDLGGLGFASGAGRKLDLHVHVDPFDYGGSHYDVLPELVPVRLDVSRTTGTMPAALLRLSGPCIRCLEPASPGFDVARARSTCRAAATNSRALPGHELDLQAWAARSPEPRRSSPAARTAPASAPVQGQLNEEPDHRHDPARPAGPLSELKLD
jgi:uncharacterized protein